MVAIWSTTALSTSFSINFLSMGGKSHDFSGNQIFSERRKRFSRQDSCCPPLSIKKREQAPLLTHKRQTVSTVMSNLAEEEIKVDSTTIKVHFKSLVKQPTRIEIVQDSHTQFEYYRVQQYFKKKKKRFVAFVMLHCPPSKKKNIQHIFFLTWYETKR